MASNKISPLDSASNGAFTFNHSWVNIDRIDKAYQTDQTLLQILWIMEGIVLVGIGGLSVIGNIDQFALMLTGTVNTLVLRQDMGNQVQIKMFFYMKAWASKETGLNILM